LTETARRRTGEDNLPPTARKALVQAAVLINRAP
jgi:hypothetical protein